MASLGKLNIVLGAVTKGLVKGLGDADRRVGSFGKSMVNLGAVAAKVTAAVVAAGAAIVTALVKNSLAAIDTQSKLARQLGGTVAGLQSLEHHAKLSGVSKEMLAQAAQRLNQRLGEVERKGAGPAKDALDRLGISARELSAMDVDERFATLADRMKAAGFSSQQMADTLRQLGIRQGEIINLLESGGDAIRNSRNEIEAFGVAVSDVDARQIEQANDAMTRIGLIMRGIGNQLAVQLAPIIEGVATALTDAAREAGGFKDAIADAVGIAIKIVGYLADGVSTLHRAWTIMSAGAVGAFNLIVQGYQKVAVAFDRMMTVISGESEERTAWVRKVQYDAFQAEMAYRKAVENMHMVNREPWPSETFNEWIENIKTKSREAAEEAVKNRAEILGGNGENEEDRKMQERLAKQEEAERKRMQARLEQLQFQLMTEEQQEIDSYNRRLEEIALFQENELISIQEAQAMKEAATSQHLDRIGAMEKRAADERKRIQDEEARARQQGWSTFWGNMESLMNSSSRAMFNIGKTAAIASSIISAYEGFNKTMAAYPYPLNIAFAGASLAASFAKIAAIKSTQFGGGSGSSSAAGGGTVSSQALTGTGADAQTRRDQTIFVRGLNPNDLVRGSDLIEAINDAIDNGSRIKLVAT
jgi:hypothetical protein